ncbi:MAG: hypothetical protein K8T90_03015, partial [Planctomycetes bacterium]|nr:hypothetical protein [Planctomycetota bacterium]
TRDFHDPATDAVVRGQFLSYLTCRERLLRLVWYYRDSQTSSPGPQSDRAFVVSYAASIELFARGMQLVEAFDGHRLAVAKLNEGDPSWGIPPGVYDRIRRNLADARALNAMTTATSRFVSLRDAGSLPTGGAWPRIVERAAAGADVASVLAAKHWHYAWDAAVARAVGHANEGYYAASTEISTWIGDTRIRARPDNRGLVTPEQLESVRARLLPGDIILERRNWYLSNAFLPGYWPHATLYVGGEEGIAQLGIAADPRVAPHLAAIRAPDQEGRRRVILEAISEGVVFTSLEESIGGADAICVLRPRLPRARCAEAVAKGIRHAGKPYDFEFDFFSTDRLVCSEVVYQAYTEDLHFPLVEIVGRKTLPPIEFVRMWTTERSRPDARFDVIAFLDADEEAGVAVERAADDLPATLDRPGMTLLQQRPDRTPLFLTAPVAALVALLSAALTIRVWRRTALRRASRA